VPPRYGLTDWSVKEAMMQKVLTSAGEVAYQETGEGPVVLLLHANLHDHHDFDPIVPALADRHRVIAVDWPAHGESDPLPGLTAMRIADVLEELVDVLDLGTAVIIGNSVGGFAAARLAIRRPDRVAGMVLVNTGGFAPQNVATRTLCRLLGTPAVARRIAPLFIRGYMRSMSDNDRAVAGRAKARVGTDAGLETFTSMWRSFNDPAHDLRESARDITAPTLVVWGARDTAIPLPLGKATAAAIPGAKFVALPTGHVVFSSAPDRFLEHVAPFVAEAHKAAAAGTA
jgi:pimeloyl-ACP methyl ester carboxylesterase